MRPVRCVDRRRDRSGQPDTGAGGPPGRGGAEEDCLGLSSVEKVGGFLEEAA